MAFGRNKIKANEVINGSFGKVFINGNKFANIKSFEAKLTFDWEEVDISEDLGKHQKFMGYQGEGTMVFHKVDSSILRMIIDDLKQGKMPEIMIVGALQDPASLGAERIQLNEVTLDETTLMKFENKTIGEEEVPFKFADFEPLDLIA